MIEFYANTSAQNTTLNLSSDKRINNVMLPSINGNNMCCMLHLLSQHPANTDLQQSIWIIYEALLIFSLQYVDSFIQTSVNTACGLMSCVYLQNMKSTLSPPSAFLKTYDLFNQRIQIVKIMWEGKDLNCKEEGSINKKWQWHRRGMAWKKKLFCNYILFAIQIIFSCTVYDFVQPFECGDPLMSSSGLLLLAVCSILVQWSEV